MHFIYFRFKCVFMFAIHINNLRDQSALNKVKQPELFSSRTTVD